MASFRRREQKQVSRSKTSRTPQARHEETAWRLANARESAVDACDTFARQVEVRNGFLGAKDSVSWSHLISAVKSIDSAIDLLVPKVSRASGIRDFAEKRAAPARPARDALSAVPDNITDIDWG